MTEPRSGEGTLAYPYRRYERGVGSDEGAGSHMGLVLVEAIIITENRSGADVGARAHRAIAEISQMVGLGPRADHHLLYLHEIADVRFRPDVGARTAGARRGR